jgi:hypothetical protein
MYICILSLISVFALLPVTSKGIPLFYETGSNLINCNDKHNYYTTTTIKNYSILYKINKTWSDYIDRPTISIIESLIHTNYNITFHAMLDIDYYLLSNCLYKCTLRVDTTEKNAHFVADHFNSLFRIGGYLHMICNSSGCNLGDLKCYTYDYHDEL